MWSRIRNQHIYRQTDETTEGLITAGGWGGDKAGKGLSAHDWALLQLRLEGALGRVGDRERSPSPL